MNILEVTTFLRGGAGVLTVQLAECFKDKGNDVSVISSGEIDDLRDWPELVELLLKKDIDHQIINIFKRESDKVWDSVRKMADVLSKKHFDVIHVHAGVPALIVKMAQNLLNIDIPTIATFHSWSISRPSWMNIADTAAFNLCDYIIYDSRAYLCQGRASGVKANDQVIYPYVNKTILKKDKKLIRKAIINKYLLPEDAVIVSNLAEITERKGQVDLIRVLNKIRDLGINAYLFLIGESKDIQYLNDIKDRIQANNLNDFVFFSGWLENPYEIVAGSDLFIFPSYSEGLGMAIVEAILHEIPTVFSSYEGMKDIEDILGDDCFGTFKPGDIEDIINTSLSTLNMSIEQREKKQQNAKAKISIEFNFDKMVREYEKVILEFYKKKKV